jgi:DNA-binding PadR family transcriptional regulator
VARSGGNNVIGLYPSRKMGRTLQFESHRCELSFIQKIERCHEALEIWDHPAKIPISYETKAGRKVTVSYIPDFLVLWKDRAEFIECKTEEELIKLSEETPSRYRRDESGEWHGPAAQENLKDFGISQESSAHSRSAANPRLINSRRKALQTIDISLLRDYMWQRNIWRCSLCGIRKSKRGGTELLILALLEDRPRHGGEIADLIEERSDGVRQFHLASHYPRPYRMEKRGLIKGARIEKAGQRRFHKLMPEGQKVLNEQRQTWSDFFDAPDRVAKINRA